MGKYLLKFFYYLNPLNANPEKWSNTLKQIVGSLPTICLSVFDDFINVALKGLNGNIVFSKNLCLEEKSNKITPKQSTHLKSTTKKYYVNGAIE